MKNEHIKKLQKEVVEVKRFLFKNYELKVSDEEVFKALVLFVESKIDHLVDDIKSIIGTPSLDEHREFMQFIPKGTIYTGKKEFSPEKLKALILFFATVLGANRLSRTRLNKLAFYSDFRHFKHSGKSISGSSYQHLPFGPVVASADDFLRQLETENTISIESGAKGGSFVNSTDGSWRTLLTPEEQQTCRIVYEKYGRLRANEISDLSHMEMAWKNTRNGQLISYDYAKLMED